VIITCEQCSTQFQLDDTRVPERGVRVRCSLCKHAFFVKPGVSVGDPVETAVERALLEDARSSPGLAPEPEALDDAVGGEDDAPFEQALDQAESDWPSTQEVQAQEAQEPEPSEDGALVAAREAVDDLLGVAPGPATSGDFEAYLGPGEAGSDEVAASDGDDPFDAPLEDLGEGVDAFADGSTDDLFADGSTDDLFAGGSLDDLGEELGVLAAEPLEDLGGLDEIGAAGELDGAGVPDLEEPDVRVGELAGLEEGLGSPESWDLLAEKGESPAPQGFTPEAPGLERALAPVVEEQREAPPIDVAVESSKLGLWIRRAASGLGWACVALLVAAGLHTVWTGGARTAPAAPAQQTVAGLHLTSVEGRWVENARDGSIYVVSGELRSGGAGRVAPGTGLSVRLFDAEGALLADRAAAVGPALPNWRIREDAPSELRAIQESRAHSMASKRSGARAGRPFHAILTEVPAEAERFDLAAIPAEEILVEGKAPARAGPVTPGPRGGPPAAEQGGGPGL
jgi:predicted Zn finger-like uncharacterized protein